MTIDDETWEDFEAATHRGLKDHDDIWSRLVECEAERSKLRAALLEQPEHAEPAESPGGVDLRAFQTGWYYARMQLAEALQVRGIDPLTLGNVAEAVCIDPATIGLGEV